MSFQNIDYSKEYFFVDHFINTDGDEAFTQSLVGATGNIVSITESGHPGINRFILGGPNTSRTSLNFFGTAGITFTSGIFEYLTVIRIGALSSTGGRQFTTMLGLIDGVGNVPSNGVYFKYNNSVNGDFWTINAANNTTTTTTVTSTPVTTGTWQTFKINVVQDGSSAIYFIDNKQIGTISTNLPTSIRSVCPAYTVNGVSGNNTIVTGLDIDLAFFGSKLTSGYFP